MRNNIPYITGVEHLKCHRYSSMEPFLLPQSFPRNASKKRVGGSIDSQFLFHVKVEEYALKINPHGIYFQHPFVITYNV